MKLDLFPTNIINEYNLRDIVDPDGDVFCEVKRGMYGLPQAGIIAQELLTSAYSSLDIASAPLRQATGAMTGAPSVSLLLSMTSV